MNDKIDKGNTTILNEKINPVGIRFKPCGKIYTFDAGEIELDEGDLVVVESMFGITIGKVITKDIKNTDQKDTKKVIRKATDADIAAYESNRSLENEARQFCLERINARGLPMKLVTTEATLDRKRIIFYFTADGRIDFRELVKDLAAKFRTRIEMRQIGVRDEAKLLGGMGICGRQLCCSSFLSNFAPISIRMAKDQELVLNTSKLTGICGRLMCCLSYEYEGPIEGEIDEALEGCLCEECKGEELPFRYLEEEKEDLQDSLKIEKIPLKESVDDYTQGDMKRTERENERAIEKEVITASLKEAKTGEPRSTDKQSRERPDKPKPFKKRKGTSSHRKRKKKKKRKGR